MLRDQASAADLLRHEELKERPPFLRLHMNTLREVVRDFRSRNDKSFERMISDVESEISECEAKIAAFDLV